MVTAAIFIGAPVLLGACGSNDDKGLGDAPIGNRNDTPADVINMPDGYPNVATKCNPYQPGTRIYVVTHSKTDVVPVIVADTTCTGASR